MGNLLSPFHLNDWEFKKLAAIALSVQFLLLILVGLSSLGVNVLLVQYVVGTIYCIFIPGALILRVLRIHKLSAIESVSLIVGVSIAFIMFAGFVINLVYPKAGLSAPLATIPVLATLTICTSLLLIACYFRDREFSDAERINVRGLLSIPTLSLCLVPFLSVFGTYAMNYYNNNSLLLVLLCVVPLVILYVCFFNPSNKLLPLALFVMSIALLYHVSLMSSHLVGWDVLYESYISKVVLENAHWNTALPDNSSNTMLSVTMLAPILSLLSGLDLIWVYKIVYPLLYTLVPLGLYEIYRKQTNEKTAFVSVVFFLSSYIFFVLMPELAKQEIAEIFVVLFALLVFNVQISGEKKALLLVISIFSIVVSHYGISYLFGLVLLTVLVNQYLKGIRLGRLKGIRLGRSTDKRGYESERTAPWSNNENDNPGYSRRRTTYTLVLLYFVFLFAWYLFATNTSNYTSIVTIGRTISGNLGQSFNPSVAEGAFLLEQQLSLLHETTRYLNIISQIAIALGLAVCALKINKKRIDSTYVYFSIGAFGLLVASVAIPYFASALNTIRIYHFSLLFLSVFFVVGWRGIADVMRAAHVKVTQKYLTIWTKCLSIFLVVLFLFNSGIVYEITHDHPESFSLNTSLDYPLFSDGDVSGATWIASTHKPGTIYSDESNKQLLMGFGLSTDWANSAPTDQLLRSYVFFGHFNKGADKVQTLAETRANNTAPYDYTFLQTNLYRIYDNGDSQVYY